MLDKISNNQLEEGHFVGVNAKKCVPVTGTFCAELNHDSFSCTTRNAYFFLQGVRKIEVKDQINSLIPSEEIRFNVRFDYVSNI